MLQLDRSPGGPNELQELSGLRMGLVPIYQKMEQHDSQGLHSLKTLLSKPAEQTRSSKQKYKPFVTALHGARPANAGHSDGVPGVRCSAAGFSLNRSVSENRKSETKTTPGPVDC